MDTITKPSTPKNNVSQTYDQHLNQNNDQDDLPFCAPKPARSETLAKPGEPEITRCCGISTAHITLETDRLLRKHVKDQEDLPIYLPKTIRGEIYGYVFLVAGFDAAELSSTPDDLCACLEYAASLGCDMLILDGDLPVVNDLPEYTWYDPALPLS